MRVDPDPAELLGLSAVIHLPVEIIGHRFIVEFHSGHTALLADQFNVPDQQWIVLSPDAEATDFCLTLIPQKQQFGPGIRREPQGRCLHHT